MSLLELGASEEAARPPFRPIRGRSIFAAASLGLHAFLSLVMILACSERISLLRSVLAHRPVSRFTLRASDLFFVLGARFHLLATLLTVVAFLLWIYRARQNLDAFRGEPFEFSPAWAVGSFFIPFVNLVQPYSAMREIWQASDPELPPVGEGSFSYVAAPVSPLLLTWWLLFLARGLTGWAAALPGLGNRTAAALLTTSQMLVVSYIVSTLAAGFAIALILLIRRRQEEFAQRFAVDVPEVF
jgi:Domain of unknown function (DUF4328)